MIIPFFIPHAGCPHQCVFCNQKNITGRSRPMEPSSVADLIDQMLTLSRDRGPAQVAFYGGTFTALPPGIQQQYLDQVKPFIHSGRVSGIRVSTRPDAVTVDIVRMLKRSGVTIVELGAQSMDDRVLTLSCRGHTADHTAQAVDTLRSENMQVGIQLMAGMPGDSAEGFSRSIDAAILLRPQSVRIYPVLVIRDTPLADLFRSGRYQPLSLDDAVTQCGHALMKLEQAGIMVIRMGLQPTGELERPGTIIAGPYHPAFRQLVESMIMLKRMRSALEHRTEITETVVFEVAEKDISNAIGNRRSNVLTLQREFGLQEVRIRAARSDELGGSRITLLSSSSAERR